MDLKDIDTIAAAEAGADMVLVHPVTKEQLLQADGKTPITIKMAGTDSNRWVQSTQRRADARIRSRQRRTPTAAEIDAESIELLVECTLAWSGVVFEGKVLECTPANVRMLYQQRPWVREQVDAFVGERANFLRV